MVLLFRWNLAFHITTEKIFLNIVDNSKFILNLKTTSSYFFRQCFNNCPQYVLKPGNRKNISRIFLFAQVLLLDFRRCSRLLEINPC